MSFAAAVNSGNSPTSSDSSSPVSSPSAKLLKKQKKRCIGKVRQSLQPCPMKDCCVDNWHWDAHSKSAQARLMDAEKKSVMFHPVWSNGTAGIRGNKSLNGGCYYWEIETGNRLFGTAMMFGVGSEKTDLHADMFLHDMIGRDKTSYGLSHKGFLWHNSESKSYCTAFKEYTPVTIGILFDGIAGTIEYWKDGVNMGVAFRDLNKVTVPLYPMISSTAAKTVMTAKNMYRSFYSLQDRCRNVILEHVEEENDIKELPLPAKLRQFVWTGI